MSAPIYNITQSHADSNQSSLNVIVNIYPFKYKDTFYKNSKVSGSQAAEAEKITITSDVLSCNVVSNKSSPVSSGEIELAAGHIDYLSAVTAGDHVAVWIVNDNETYTRVSNAALANEQCNDANSGLKFLGRVKTIQENVIYSEGGVRSVTYRLQLEGFSELNSLIYFNRYLWSNYEVGSQSENSVDAINQSRFAAMGYDWQNLIPSDGSAYNCGIMIDAFIDIFLGPGPANRREGGEVKSTNAAFLIPNLVGKLFGINGVNGHVQYADLLHTFIGIQSFKSGREENDFTAFIPENRPSKDKKNQRQALTQISKSGKSSRLGYTLYGDLMTLPDPYNGGSIWSVLQAHANLGLNELYNTLRIGYDGNIHPTLTARQVPFTTPHAAKELKSSGILHTQFTDLPRWKIDPKMIRSMSIGASDSARVNFVQVYGDMTRLHVKPDFAMIDQIRRGNYRIDNADIYRNGGRNVIKPSLIDMSKTMEAINVSDWAKVIGDFFINGHLKLNGMIVCNGIVPPICIGDNVQVGNKLLHIEAVSHQYAAQGGYKSFTTSLSVSNGVLDNGDYYYNSNPAGQRATDPDVLKGGFTDEEIYVNNKSIVSGTTKIGIKK